jgi:hypothetical protein
MDHTIEKSDEYKIIKLRSGLFIYYVDVENFGTGLDRYWAHRYISNITLKEDIELLMDYHNLSLERMEVIRVTVLHKLEPMSALNILALY